MKSPNSILSIVRSELNRVITDHSILLTVIIAPVLYTLFLGSIYQKKDINKVPFAVVDHDHSKTTRTLTRQLAASQKIELTRLFAGDKEAEHQLKQLNIQGYIVFPRGFEKDRLKKGQAHVDLFLNTTRFLPSNTLNMAVNKVMMEAGTRVRVQHLEANGVNPKVASAQANPVEPVIKPMYNVTNSYGDFLLPALFFIILQQTLLLGLTESISRDRQEGVLMPVLQSSKQGLINYMVAKPTYYILLYLTYIFFFTYVIFPLFGLPVKASLFPIMAISLLFILAVAIYSLLVGSYIKKQTHAMEILAFSTYPLFLLSGYSWPVSAMPAVLRGVSALIPTTPMLEAMQRLYLMGGTWQSVIPQFQHLLIILGISIFLLVLRLLQLRLKTATPEAGSPQSHGREFVAESY